MSVTLISTPLVLFMLANDGCMVEEWDSVPPPMQDQAFDAARKFRWISKDGETVTKKGETVIDELKQTLKEK